MNTMRRLALMIALPLCLLALRKPATAELKDGDVLGPSNWADAQGLLPDEILDHYRQGDYLNPILDINKPGYLSLQLPADFQEATRANAGRYVLSDAGSIIETGTGQQPAFVFGLPFPDIDPRDPQAATKIVWNYFYSDWYSDNTHFLTELVLLSRGGVDRRLSTEVYTLMYDGAADARGRANPNNLLSQQMARVVFPTDLAGTTSLTWRYRDPDKHDSLWTYVPGLRRARQVSALNRSDGFLGSDISLDDGAFFDAKPEDFTFKLFERHDQFVLVDPFSVRGKGEVVPVAGGRLADRLEGRAAYRGRRAGLARAPVGAGECGAGAAAGMDHRSHTTRSELSLRPHRPALRCTDLPRELFDQVRSRRNAHDVVPGSRRRVLQR